MTTHQPEHKPMPLHELINVIQKRLRHSVEFTLVEPDFVRFKFAHQSMHSYGFDGTVYLKHILDNGQMAESLHSKYWEGVINGGKRDDAGNLINHTEEKPELELDHGA